MGESMMAHEEKLIPEITVSVVPAERIGDEAVAIRVDAKTPRMAAFELSCGGEHRKYEPYRVNEFVADCVYQRVLDALAFDAQYSDEQMKEWRDTIDEAVRAWSSAGRVGTEDVV
jgi:hypothetical protein